MATYACSDLHGRLDLLKQIQDFLQPDDTVYFLGDAGDRGPEPWKTIKAVAQDKRFIYLKGNHEDMLVKAMEDDIKYDHLHADNYLLLVANNGGRTFFEWEQEENQSGWWHYLKTLPTYEKYINRSGYTIHLCHAGFNPLQDDVLPDDDDLLWDRQHFLTPKPIFEDRELCVHGHTPIPLLINRITWQGTKNSPKWDGNALWYGGYHKIDLDCASWYTGRIILLDLDTFDEYTFLAENAIDLVKEVW